MQYLSRDIRKLQMNSYLKELKRQAILSVTWKLIINAPKSTFNHPVCTFHRIVFSLYMFWKFHTSRV